MGKAMLAREGRMAAGRSGGLKLRARADFFAHAARFALFGAASVTAALAVGMIGYRAVAGMDWVDAFFNASMILSGMGPVDPMPDDRAKLFAGIYALFGGAVYPAVTAIVLYPFLHRMLVLLHIQAKGDGQDD